MGSDFQRLQRINMQVIVKCTRRLWPDPGQNLKQPLRLGLAA